MSDETVSVDLIALATQLAVIDTKLDVLIEQRADIEVRVRGLERFKWAVFGLAAASGGLWQGISTLAA